MADWLVPISTRTRVLDRGGRRLAPRFETVRAAVLAGRATAVAVEVRGALADSHPGDSAWIYWGDQDIGVMAVGELRPRRARAASPELGVELDLARSRLLVVDPMPAPLVRRWMHDVRAVARLDARPRVFEAVRAWEHDRAHRDEAMLRPLSLPSWRSRAARGAVGRRPVDDPLLSSVVPFLRSQDFAVGLATHEHQPRLVARRTRDLLVVHGVRDQGGRRRDEALRAFGVVRAHRWALVRDHAEVRLRAWAWLSFAVRPPNDVVAFLEEEGVLVTWLHRGTPTQMSDRSKQRWYQQLGVR